jgi:methylthioribose-1-phosphate isomerase
MAGYFMGKGEVDKVVVGADRIASNGDTANKIGTYSLAVLADYHGIPFYVAAPVSTIDFSIQNGSEIPIEERDMKEVTQFNSQKITPEGAQARNPAFDITPNYFITAIITEKGVFEKLHACSIRDCHDQNLYSS